MNTIRTFLRAMMVDSRKIISRLRSWGKRVLTPTSFEDIWIKNSSFPEQVSLILSLICTSNCIFCAEKGKNIKEKLMPFELVVKILKELQEYNFKGGFNLSEFGDVLTHLRFKEIVMEIRKLFPRNNISLYSNMVLMNEDNAKFLLENNLNYLHFNFDGFNEINYEYIKRNQKYKQVKQNILNFFKLRDEINPNCVISIGIVSAKRFSEEIEDKLGLFEDDENKIKEFFRPYLKKQDNIKSDVISLEKYENFLLREKKEPCRMFDRILKDIFIAPNGQVYICCCDYGITSNLGNVNYQTIKEIWSSELRRNILKNLFALNFKKAFEVCRTCLPYLNTMPEYLKVKKRLRRMFKEKRLEFINGKLVINSNSK